MAVERAEQSGTISQVPVLGSELPFFIQAAHDLNIRLGQIRFAEDEKIQRDEEDRVVNERCSVEIDGSTPNAYARIVERAHELSQPH